jgi:hypothetical protein
MVDITSINTSFSGLVGWKQPANPDYAIVEEELLLSSSGQFFQDMSNLVTVENIKENQPYPTIADDDFNLLLTDLSKSALTKVMASLFYDGDVISNKVLFAEPNDWQHPINNSGDFVGFKIDTCKSKKFSAKINSISLSFDANQPVKVLLFHTSKLAPLKTVTIAALANTEVTVSVDWLLPLQSGEYYIGYLTSGLTGRALDRLLRSSFCMSNYNVIEFESIKVSGHNVETLFDINTVTNVSSAFGINVDVSEYLDYTSIAIANKQRLTNAWIMQLSADVLDLIVHSTRSNDNERINRASAAYELNGTMNNPELPKMIGIANKLKAEIAALRKLIESQTITKLTAQ